MEIARLTALVKNRHQSFYNYAEGIDMQKKVVNPDEFCEVFLVFYFNICYDLYGSQN